MNKQKSSDQFIKELKNQFNLKGKDALVTKLLFQRYLRIYTTRLEAENKTIKEVELYIAHRKNKKNN